MNLDENTDGYDVGLCSGFLNEEELSRCLAIIEEGEAVDIDAAMENLPAALTVAVARKEGEAVGVGAIKAIRPGYARHAARNSEFAFDPNMHELGYVAVTEAHRGKRLSERIVDELLSQYAGPLFATTSSPAMK